MRQYAKTVEQALQYPTEAEFPGVFNWRDNDPALRRAKYLPLVCDHQPPEGYTTTPTDWVTVPQSETRVEKREVVIPIYDEGDPTRQIGERREWQDVEITIDTSYIRVVAWRDDPVPEPEPPDTTEREAAERVIVAAILALARKYDAVEDLLALEDLTIPALQALASEKSVTLADWAELISTITPMKWQLEAVEGGTWADCWLGLKERFPGYLEELINQ